MCRYFQIPKSLIFHIMAIRAPARKGSVMVVAFELDGRRFTALNGGPGHKLSEAFSLLVDCTEQADIDRLCKL